MNASKILNLNARNKKERRFSLYGRLSIGFALLFLILLFGTILQKSFKAFWRTEIALQIDLGETLENRENPKKTDFRQLIKSSLRQQFKDAKSLQEISALYELPSRLANLELKNFLEKKTIENSLVWVSASSKVDMFFKHGQKTNLSEKQLAWLETLAQNQQLRTVFNWKFFSYADSREPEIAGIAAGFIGSVLIIIVFMLLAFPVAIMCAFYLEEFAPKNRFTDLIEISINNLAAVPSIIYGLLGLVLYLQFFNLPRSSSLVGGLTLFMLVLPIITITTRNAIRTIPKPIREGAMALGASKMQIILHHLLPLSIPGIMTGTILAISRALGETAPLLMIGMIAFIADVPQSFVEPSSALPVQIFLWSDLPENGFVEKTSAAILVLLTLLVALNLTAIILRKKFEKKW